MNLQNSNSNLENYFTTSTNKKYLKVNIPKDILKDKKETLRTILYLSVFYYQVCNLKELYRIYKHYNINAKDAKGFVKEYSLSGNKKIYININIVKTNTNIKGDFEEYFKLTDVNKANFLTSNKYNFIKELIEKDIEKKYRYVDSYSLATKQHTNIKHYSTINYLYLKSIKENIKTKYKHDETSFDVNCFKDYYYINHRKVEFDLTMIYNKKQIGVEVECGSTSNSDMYKKIIKHHALAYEQGIYKDIVIACPNKKALEKTRATIEKAIDKYYIDDIDNFNCSFAVRYYYLNLSELNNKTLRSFLNEAINKKLHQY